MTDFAVEVPLWAPGNAGTAGNAAVAALSDGAVLDVRKDGDAAIVRVMASTSETTLVRLDVPLGSAVGYWHPGGEGEQPLPADWQRGWRPVGLVRSAPVGVLYDGAGRVLLGVAAHTTTPAHVRFGVSETLARYGIWLAVELAAGASYEVRVESGGAVGAALGALARWLTRDPLPVPAAARTPAYSTWYSYHRDVTAERVTAEAREASALGCGVLLLDDGWQRNALAGGYSGCGDWVPDAERFGDLGAHVAAVHDLGMRHVAWVGPLMLGPNSSAYRTLAGNAPREVSRLSCRILDPRRDATREYVVDGCVSLVDRYGLDGLKVDFLDLASVYADDGGDELDAALALLCTELVGGLHALRGDELLIELRQPYAGPAMRRFGNLLRAGDCPADATANRVRTRDIAALAPDSAVHSDMLMWDPAASPESAAHQLQSALYAVPQVSVRLTAQSAAHRDVTATWLAFWRRYAEVLLDGERHTGTPDDRYATVTATAGDRAVTTVYAPGRTAPVDPVSRPDTALVNATDAADVVVDVATAATVRLDVSDARGRAVGGHTAHLSPGPHRLAVPPAGSCLITPA